MGGLVFAIFFFYVFLPAFRAGVGPVLFRAWVPAWRYFNSNEGRLVIWYREPEQDWRRYDPSLELTPSNLLFNLEGNTILLRESLLRMLLQNSNQNGFYALIESALFEIGRDAHPSCDAFYFKITEEFAKKEEEYEVLSEVLIGKKP
jgi:hypothetical protein